jgi:hypothetical protein
VWRKVRKEDTAMEEVDTFAEFTQENRDKAFSESER